MLSPIQKTKTVKVRDVMKKIWALCDADQKANGFPLLNDQEAMALANEAVREVRKKAKQARYQAEQSAKSSS